MFKPNSTETKCFVPEIDIEIAELLIETGVSEDITTF